MLYIFAEKIEKMMNAEQWNDGSVIPFFFFILFDSRELIQVFFYQKKKSEKEMFDFLGFRQFITVLLMFSCIFRQTKQSLQVKNIGLRTFYFLKKVYKVDVQFSFS